MGQKAGHFGVLFAWVNKPTILGGSSHGSKSRPFWWVLRIGQKADRFGGSSDTDTFRYFRYRYGRVGEGPRTAMPMQRVTPLPWFLGMDHITSDHITSAHITSHHITSHRTTPQHGPGAKRQQMARNESGIDENQHNLVKTIRNCDASPAATTGMRQDP